MNARLFERIHRMHGRFGALYPRMGAGFVTVPQTGVLAETGAAVAAERQPPRDPSARTVGVKVFQTKRQVFC